MSDKRSFLKIEVLQEGNRVIAEPSMFFAGFNRLEPVIKMFSCEIKKDTPSQYIKVDFYEFNNNKNDWNEMK